MAKDDLTIQRTQIAIENARKAGDDAAVIVLQNDLARLQADAHMPQPAGAGERFVRGMAEPVLGAGQVMARPLAALGSAVNRATGGIGGDYLESLPGRMDQIAGQYKAESDAMAPTEGMDAARIGGQMVALAPTAVAGGIPATAGALARTGAAIGGVTGATQIADDPSKPFVRQKLEQAGGGAVFGAVGSPIVGKALQVLGRGAGGIVQALDRRGLSVRDIEARIQSRLVEAGIDISELGPAFIKQTAREVKRAQALGGDLDDAAFQRLARFRQVGIDKPTVGQLTQNPVQFSDEKFLMQSQAGKVLADQYKQSLIKLNQRIDGLMQSTGKARVPAVEAGEKVFGALKSIDQPIKQNINDAYTIARQSNTGVYRDGLRGLVAHIDDALDQADLDPRVSSRLMQELGRLKQLADDMADMDGAASVDLKDLEKARRFFSSLRGSSDASEARVAGVAVRAYDRYLANAADDVFRQPPGVSAQGESGVLAFNRARKAAADRFKQLERLPALDDFLSGKLAPDDFMRKAVKNAKLAEVKELRNYLLNNGRDDAWDQIRVQVMGDLKNAATKGSDELQDFSQDRFNTALNGLIESKKAEVLFNSRELSMLRAIGSVGRNIQRGPPGQVSTGFAGAAKAMNLFSKMLESMPTRLGATVRAVGQNAGDRLRAEAAAKTPSVIDQGPTIEAIASAGRAVGPAAVAIQNNE